MLTVEALEVEPGPLIIFLLEENLPTATIAANMARLTAPLQAITVTELACLICRTAYNTLLDMRKTPPHTEPTLLDFLVSVHGLTAWVFAQHDLRKSHPRQSTDDMEAFLRKQEAQRNELILTTGTLLDKGSAGYLLAQSMKEQQWQWTRRSREEDWDRPRPPQFHRRDAQRVMGEYATGKGVVRVYGW
jgi:hypothetical protein